MKNQSLKLLVSCLLLTVFGWGCTAQGPLTFCLGPGGTQLCYRAVHNSTITAEVAGEKVPVLASLNTNPIKDNNGG